MTRRRMGKRAGVILSVVLALSTLATAAFADLTKTTANGSGRAFYDSSQNKFRIDDLACDGYYVYVNYAFNSNGATPTVYSTHQAAVGCGNSESWIVTPTNTQVVFRVCIYVTLGSDQCSTWGSTNA